MKYRVFCCFAPALKSPIIATITELQAEISMEACFSLAVQEETQKQAQAQELLFHHENGRNARTSEVGTSSRIKTFPFSCSLFNVFLVQMEPEAREINVLSYFYLSSSQSTRSRFVRSLTKIVKADRNFEERFSETVRQFPVIYDNGRIYKELVLVDGFFLHR